MPVKKQSSGVVRKAAYGKRHNSGRYRYKCQITSVRVNGNRWSWAVYHGYKLISIRETFTAAVRSMITWQENMKYADD